ncbi:UNVERIFIED_CONTAM: Receptor-like protein 54 [Sesamum radiatum]|uniref:Receptor-like protein 54 n=1 Tax=Sesamum radiatum TaxID=300843 RepID=A0AAW2R5Q0_SESRA
MGSLFIFYIGIRCVLIIFYSLFLRLLFLNLGNNDLNDNFPGWLKNLTGLRVLVVSTNKFHGNISCLWDSITCLNLQIIDIASNEFNSVLPENLFRELKALTVAEDGLDHLNFLYPSASRIYYQDSKTLTLKGPDVELGKLLNIFTSVDFSNNHFQGIIPETVGELKSLYVLNFSHNMLPGHIPRSIGNMEELESLDLSFNNLGGEIPQQLASLTFLSFLNLSYNTLVGRIPQGSQMQTFPTSLFLGNEGLCGFPLNRTCIDRSGSPASLQPTSEEEEDQITLEHGIYISAASGFFVGLGVIFWPLVLSKRWRRCYNKFVNKAVLLVLRRHLHQLEDCQKELLHELRNNLTYDSSFSTKLARWNESIDCCQWPGVKCDTRGRVSSLDLSGESITDGINDDGSSLFRLVFLENLSLAQNSFGAIDLPFGFGKLTELSYLNLSNSGFSGQIPLDFSNLTRLVVLDFTNTIYSLLKLENPNLERLIQNFRRLRELYLDGVNISAKGYEWCNAISSSLPNLRVLSLSNAYLTGPIDSSLAKLRALSVIRLDGNAFSSPFPEFFADFLSLRVLTISSCNLSGVAPAKLFQIKSLETVDLSGNRLSSESVP